MTYINVYHDEGFECLDEGAVELPIAYSWEFVIVNRDVITEELLDEFEGEKWEEEDLRLKIQEILEPMIRSIVDHTETLLEELEEMEDD